MPKVFLDTYKNFKRQQARVVQAVPATKAAFGRRSLMLKFTTALLLTFAALPVMAETPAKRSANNASTSLSVPAGSGFNAPSTANPVITDNGGMRTSKIVGSAVYNDHDQKVGSIDDVVIGNDRTWSAAKSVGGFLGLGSKMGEVPFDTLQFGNNGNSNANRVVVPNVTADTLNAMHGYHYVDRG